MQIQNLFNKEDRAVSPVIGVILMVAITVILAAVIGTFVLGLGSNVSQNAQAGVTFSQDSATNDVTITINSIQRADSFTVKVDGTDQSLGTFAGVGDTHTVSTPTDGAKITVIASYEGNENVIGEYTVK
ncbi:type IV pilin [Halogranum rubrum]|uniref:type IV pilin n=1 Tax=Halogranum rubrum TaxID=553466 RepID=UPI000677850F|nr:type IV pilin N-terminal domain-containing protein [Halogranum salarium]